MEIASGLFALRNDTRTAYWYSRYAQVPNARLGHVQASLTAALALRICPTVYFLLSISYFLLPTTYFLSSLVSRLSSKFLHLSPYVYGNYSIYRRNRFDRGSW